MYAFKLVWFKGRVMYIQGLTTWNINAISMSSRSISFVFWVVACPTLDPPSGKQHLIRHHSCSPDCHMSCTNKGSCCQTHGLKNRPRAIPTCENRVILECQIQQCTCSRSSEVNLSCTCIHMSFQICNISASVIQRNKMFIFSLPLSLSMAHVFT